VVTELSETKVKVSRLTLTNTVNNEFIKTNTYSVVQVRYS